MVLEDTWFEAIQLLAATCQWAASRIDPDEKITSIQKKYLIADADGRVPTQPSNRIG